MSMVTLLLPIKAVMAFLDIDEKYDFVVADEFQMRLCKLCKEAKIMARGLRTSMLSRAIILVKTSPVLNNTFCWLQACAMLDGACYSVRIKGAELAVDVASGCFCAISEAHC